MPKEAISVSLEAENLLWLRGRTRAGAARSVSQLLDRLVEGARRGGGAAHARSVVGTVTIAPEDPGLEGADAVVRDAFAHSLHRGRGRAGRAGRGSRRPKHG